MCQISCFYHKMHDSLTFGHLAAGLVVLSMKLILLACLKVFITVKPGNNDTDLAGPYTDKQNTLKLTHV